MLAAMRTAIVTAANDEYFPWVCDLVASIREHELQRTEICVLDVGFTEAQRSQMREMVSEVVDPGWDLPIAAAGAAQGILPLWFKAMSARPFLPRHFPNYDVLLWADADIWLQDWRGVDLMMRAGEQHGFAIVPEVHQSYDYLYDIHRVADTRDYLYQSYRGLLNEDGARKLSNRAIFNSGFFAARNDSPHWRVWQQMLERLLPLAGTHGRLVEQNALNIAIYGGNVPMPHRLPAWCNWLCVHALPALDPATGRLVDPMMPHEPLSVIHMAGGMKATIAMPITTGGAINTRFDYQTARKLRAAAPYASSS